MSTEKKLIDKLTPEQEAKIPEYLEKYKKIGLSTGPTDKGKAEAAVRRAYEYMHKKDGSCVPNPEFIWEGSPRAGQRLAAQYAKGDENVTTEEIQAQASMASYGSFEAYWVSTYDFIAKELPVEKDELCDIVVEIVETCGVYWSFEDLVIMTPKPLEIHLKGDKLHNDSGSAMSYPDGNCVYAIDGEIKASLMEIAIAKRVSEEEETVATGKKAKGKAKKGA